MRFRDQDRARCALIVQRLMDADLLLPAEGEALLVKIETWEPSADGTDSLSTCADRFSQALTAMMQSDHSDGSARQAALETAHALLLRPTEKPEEAKRADENRRPDRDEELADEFQ